MERKLFESHEDAVTAIRRNLSPLRKSWHVVQLHGKLGLYNTSENGEDRWMCNDGRFYTLHELKTGAWATR